MVHPSKIDLWLAVLLALLPLTQLAVAAGGLVEGEPAALWIGLGAFVFVLALYGGVVLPTRYEVGPVDLVVRFGLARSRIPLATIRSVEPGRTFLSAPALSLDRLRVEHGGKFATYVSPRDKGAFLDDLARAAPHLRREGDRLVSP